MKIKFDGKEFIEWMDAICLERVEKRTNYKPLELSIRLTGNKCSVICKEVYNHFKVSGFKSRVSKNKITRVVEVLMANVVTSDKKYIGYSRSPNSYKFGVENPQKVSFCVLKEVLEALDQLGYIRQHLISAQSKAKDRSFSRIEFNKNKCKELMKSDLEVEAERIVFIKNDEKEYVDVKNKERKRLRCIENRLKKINKTLNLASYSINTNEYFPPQLKRIFNKRSLDFCGRFYSLYGMSYMNMPKRDRAKIRINNIKTVELDFKNLHPNLLYSMKSKQLSSDLYSIEGYKRKDVKKVFLIAMNSNSIASACKAIVVDSKNKIQYKEAKEILTKILDRNPCISSLFFKKNLALVLQNKDSMIAERVMLEFIEETGSSILPVHDSFIVQINYKEVLKAIMKRVYREYTGYEIEVS